MIVWIRARGVRRNYQDGIHQFRINYIQYDCVTMSMMTVMMVLYQSMNVNVN